MFRGNFNPSEKYEFVGWDDSSQDMEKITFHGSKPPTRVNPHGIPNFPMVFLHFPMGFPMKSPFSHGFPMVFPWFSQFEALTQEPPWEPASEASRPRLAGSPMTSIQDGEAPRSPIRSYQGLPQSMIQRDFQTCD